MSRTLLILGGTAFQIGAIQAARALGHRVVTCDYLPTNPGHRLAHAYHCISTTDRSAVLALAQDLRIDGILAYASDPAAPTAAYVAEVMGLPGNPLSAVEILTHKDLYRDFCQRHHFHAPAFRAVQTVEQALDALSVLGGPVMVKPVDASGSKGVSRVDHAADMAQAMTQALRFSRCQRAIIENWVERQGHQIAGDGFVVQGQLVFHCLAQEHFNHHAGRFVPAGESFPLCLDRDLRQHITAEIQRMITLLGLRDGALNFDIMLDAQHRVHLMEVGPRSGGNLIPEVITLATGVDLTAYAVKAALGLDCSDLTQVECQGCYACAVVHTENNGLFEALELGPGLHCIEQRLFVEPGAPVQTYAGSHCSLGMVLLRFEDSASMIHRMDHLRDHLHVRLQPPPSVSHTADRPTALTS